MQAGQWRVWMLQLAYDSVAGKEGIGAATAPAPPSQVQPALMQCAMPPALFRLT